MANNATAKVSLLKKELAALIAIVETEKQRYDAIDYDSLSDDEAGDTGDEHETIDGILVMLKASYADTFN
ncbi:hypothetical protein [Rheinheimera sp.]|uniref:hypothetical protein n=1 Tax=Rheinheimera sp. TaxID=1869214 RepID=UPI004048B4E6